MLTVEMEIFEVHTLFKTPRTPCREVQHILGEHHEPGAAWGIGDRDGTTSQPSEISGEGGVQGLGFKSGRTTWVLTGGARVTLWSREEKSRIPRGNASRSEGRHLNWLQQDEYRLWWTKTEIFSGDCKGVTTPTFINPLQSGSFSLDYPIAPQGSLNPFLLAVCRGSSKQLGFILHKVTFRDF